MSKGSTRWRRNMGMGDRPLLCDWRGGWCLPCEWAVEGHTPGALGEDWHPGTNSSKRTFRVKYCMPWNGRGWLMDLTGIKITIKIGWIFYRRARERTFRQKDDGQKNGTRTGRLKLRVRL